MTQVQQLLQISARLYQHVITMPTDEERDEHIEKTHQLLDKRSELIMALEQQNFKVDKESQMHRQLVQLDEGILEGLNQVMSVIKEDMKVLQSTKKNEQRYMNPYANVGVMDGKYYDKKN